ncbi:hypothetical protein [Sporocytophaga myxococcoides]|uniref:hypothetical protein n=1 Tax=Sporocytophaga myxococcoides TaxID=153721 RepID=UPI0012DCC55B|nr:hypothetical protein [Sporocytophaga myxococcoides]
MKNDAVSEESPKDSIVFITMRIWSDSLESGNNIEVLKIIKKPGTLKNPLIGNMKSENYLNCIAINEKNNIKDSFCIEHPLYREIELLDEKNQLLKRNINLKESEFFVRFEKKNYDYLIIKENSPVTKDKKIISIKF